MRQNTAASKNLVDRLQLQVTEHGSDLESALSRLTVIFVYLSSLVVVQTL